jgi:hypothetical protein
MNINQKPKKMMNNKPAMLNPLEILQATHLKLFSLSPSQALELKKKTISLLKDLPANKYQRLAHQISQERKVKENFLTWLESNCPCDECEEN